LIDKDSVGSAIRAFSILRGPFPKAEFIIAARPAQPELQSARAKSSALLGSDSAVFSAWDLRHFRTRAYFHIHSETPPERKSGRSANSILEAWRTGLPIIATRLVASPKQSRKSQWSFGARAAMSKASAAPWSRSEITGIVCAFAAAEPLAVEENFDQE